MEIGQSIQEARKKAKLTQKELAEKAGISIATITKMGKDGAGGSYYSPAVRARGQNS